MSKIFKKINFSAIAGGLAGGAAASLIETMIPDDFLSGDNKDKKTGDYVKIAIMAVGGSVISSMSKNNLIQSVGNGMLGLAGANLYDLVMSGAKSDQTKTETETETEKTPSGIGRIRRIGLLPSQTAVGNLPSQSAVGSAKWIKDKKNQNVY